MADAITIKALQDASLDAKSLEEVVNGNEVKQVTTRKGETYPSVKKAVKTMFDNGGLPATPFATKALMTASALVDGKYAMVTDDTDNNGLYVKTAGAWVKSDYGPLNNNDLYVAGADKPNLIQGSGVSDFYVAAGVSVRGKITYSASGTALQVFSITAGETYAIYSSDFNPSVFVLGVSDSGFAAGKLTTPLDVTDTSNPNVKTFVAPAGMTHGFITTLLTSLSYDVRNTLWVNKGSVTSKFITTAVTKINDINIRDEVAHDRLDALVLAPQSKLEGKRWAAVGDSLTQKNTRTNKNYYEFIQDTVDELTVYNYGLGGTGYFNRTDAASKITQDVDLVTVFMGTNDWGNQTEQNQKPLGVFLDEGVTTISGCINTTLLGLVNKFPTKKIAVITPIPRLNNWGSNADNNAYGYTLEQLSQLIIQYCEHYSIPCLDLYHSSGLYVYVPAANDYYFTAPAGSLPDGLHPNDAGHQVIASKVKSFLESI